MFTLFVTVICMMQFRVAHNYWILDDFEDSFLEKSIFLRSEINGRNVGLQNFTHPTPHRNPMTYWVLHYKCLTHKNKNNSKNIYNIMYKIKLTFESLRWWFKCICFKVHVSIRCRHTYTLMRTFVITSLWLPFQWLIWLILQLILLKTPWSLTVW